jgi:hypothetical protein
MNTSVVGVDVMCTLVTISVLGWAGHGPMPFSTSPNLNYELAPYRGTISNGSWYPALAAGVAQRPRPLLSTLPPALETSHTLRMSSTGSPQHFDTLPQQMETTSASTILTTASKKVSRPRDETSRRKSSSKSRNGMFVSYIFILLCALLSVHGGTAGGLVKCV